METIVTAVSYSDRLSTCASTAIADCVAESGRSDAADLPLFLGLGDVLVDFFGGIG